MSGKARDSGYVSVMAVFVVAIGAVLSLWLYSITVTSTAVAGNNLNESRATAAAQSGLQYMQHKVGEILSAHPVSAGADDNAMLSNIAAAITTDGTCAATASYTTGKIRFENATLSDGSAFSSVIVPSSSAQQALGHSFSLQVTGINGTARRTVGIEMDKKANGGFSALNFPMASKGSISLPPSANGGVFEYNTTLDPPSLDQNYKGSVAAYNGINVVQFSNSPTPTGTVVFPTEPTSMYTRLEQLVGSTLSDYTKGNSNNVYIPAGTNPTLSGTLSGVIYVRWPNSITFANNTVINGVIIYQPAKDNTTPAITIDRTYALTITPPSATTLQTAFGSNYWTDCGDFTVGWAIIAPATDFCVTNGNDAGLKQINGAMHLHSYTGAGSGNVLKKLPTTGELLVNNGSILCEGNITLNGNAAFSVNPPSGGVGGMASTTYSLAISFANFWEQ